MHRRRFLIGLTSLPAALAVGKAITQTSPVAPLKEFVPMHVVVDASIAKQNALWGTFGKGGVEHCNGTCPEHQLRWVRLIDCETEHLEAILQLSFIPYDYTELILDILRDRRLAAKKG